MALHQLCSDFVDKPKSRLPDPLGALWEREYADGFGIGRNKVQRAVNNNQPWFERYTFHADSPLQQAPAPSV